MHVRFSEFDAGYPRGAHPLSLPVSYHVLVCFTQASPTRRSSLSKGASSTPGWSSRATRGTAGVSTAPFWYAGRKRPGNGWRTPPAIRRAISSAKSMDHMRSHSTRLPRSGERSRKVYSAPCTTTFHLILCVQATLFGRVRATLETVRTSIVAFLLSRLPRTPTLPDTDLCRAVSTLSLSDEPGCSQMVPASVWLCSPSYESYGVCRS